MKSLPFFLTSLLVVGCFPSNDGLQRYSTDWCTVRIPPEWSTKEDAYSQNRQKAKQLNLSDPTSNITIDIHNLSPPIPNPAWSFAHQMLSMMNEIAGQQHFLGSEVQSVSRSIGSKSRVAYCMSVTVSDPDYPRELMWETFKISHNLSDTFIIVSYPIDAPEELSPVLDSILKSLKVD